MAENAEAADGRGNVTPATIIRARQDRTEAKASLETAKARYRACGKKIESWGVDLKELDKVIEFARRDQEDLRGEFSTFIHYCKVLQLPIGTQLSLLDDDTTPVTLTDNDKEQAAAWDAGDQGYRAGKNGEPAANNTYPPGSLAFTAWAEYHKRGLALFQEGAVPKRGRPRKEASADNQAAA